MKWYAIKDLETSEIKLMACAGDAASTMKMVSPDKVASGAGTEEDPYVYEATAELMDELSVDEDGKQILPDREFRGSWVDSAGAVSIDLASAKEEKKAVLAAACKEACKVHIDEMMDAMADDDAGAESTAKAAVAAAKASLASDQADCDGAADVAALKAL